MKKSVIFMNLFLIIGLIFGSSITIANLADANKEIELNPKSAINYYERSKIWLEQGKRDEALADANKAIEIYGNYAEAYALRGELKQEKGEWNAALTDINKALELAPDFAKAYFIRSKLWQEKGKWDEALADTDKAIKNYGIRYYGDGAGVYDAAYALRTEILQAKGEWDQEAEERQGREKQAIQEEAERQVTEKQAREKKEKENALTQASIWWSKGELSKAQADLNKGIEYNPQLLKLPLSHLKKPTFLNIGDTRRLVTDQEVFLVNDSTGKILYPYPDVAVELANLTEGETIEVVGECPKKETLCPLKLRVVADLDLEHALLWENKLPPQSTEIQVQPSLSKVYTFTAEIPLEMASKPFELVLVSRKGRSFKYELQLQGTQLQIKQTPKGLADEL